jgi:hypothetical protein
MEGRKGLLFLKKKKQKDFCPFAPQRLGTILRQTDKSFLVLFSKKEHSFLGTP